MSPAIVCAALVAITVSARNKSAAATKSATRYDELGKTISTRVTTR